MSPTQNINSDRISSLHDSILYQIFSFLPTEDAVRTSILSKRWQNLWIFLPYLHFSHDEFSTSFFLDSERYAKFRNNMIRFPKFVNNIMKNRDQCSSIIRFQLKCGQECDGYQIGKWINTAISGGVRDLDIRTDRLTFLPSSLFTCNSLVSLKLEFDGCIHFPEVFCLPNLKIMHLLFIILPKKFADQLLKSPNLEELVLTDCSYGLQNWNNHITADQVQDPDNNNVRIVSKLKKTIISYLFVTDRKDRYIDRGMVNGFSKLIRQSYTVEVMRLSHPCIQLLHHKKYLFKYLPSFCNLKHLDIGICNDDVHVGVLGCLLHLCPVLESLAIEFNNDVQHILEILVEYNNEELLRKYLSNLEEETSISNNNSDQFFGRAKRELEPEESEYHSLCVPPSLKRIEVTKYHGMKIQFELLRFFSANAQALEKMIVKLRKPQYVNQLLRQELLSLPKLSTSLVLDVIQWNNTGWNSSGLYE